MKRIHKESFPGGNMASVLLSSVAAAYRLPIRASKSVLRIDQAHDSNTPVDLHFLDAIQNSLESPHVTAESAYEAVDQLFRAMAELRNASTPERWKEIVQEARQHPILQLVHQDPFTRRAYEKPRSYAGDAVMMDYIYGCEENWEMPEATELGRHVFHYTSHAQASAGVRARREHIANSLDETASRIEHPEVLAVACGHLREASMSSAVRRRRFGRFIGLDADALSLQEVDRSYSRFGITPARVDVRRLMTGRTELGSFDLIYSTGLYDYLNETSGAKLTYHLFSMLRPKGKLIVANFLPTIPDIGYMESFMDWWLIYRDRIDMVALTQYIPQEEIQGIHVSVEENQNIIFLEMAKR